MMKTPKERQWAIVSIAGLFLITNAIAIAGGGNIAEIILTNLVLAGIVMFILGLAFWDHHHQQAGRQGQNWSAK